jgi:hypothetical protein
MLGVVTDPMTIYYSIYFIVTVLGYTKSDYFLPFLLLDIIVKNSTTKNVLLAIVKPRWQLFITAVLTLFITFIFSFIIVSTFF